jgi:hypothetical protein
MSQIINLTQFKASKEQIEDNVIDLKDNSELKNLLTFTSMPTKAEVRERAEKIATIAAETGCTQALISGAPYLMSELEISLLERNINPLYSFSVRKSIEKTQEDGSVVKTNVFVHKGFVSPYNDEITPQKENILNLTQHDATKEQQDAGVIEPENKDLIRQFLTFDDIPSRKEIESRAEIIAQLASLSNCKKAMIGGAPYFMSTLETALTENGIEPCYAYSERVVNEQTKEDGSVEKVSTFVHKGFVSALDDFSENNELDER